MGPGRLSQDLPHTALALTMVGTLLSHIHGIFSDRFERRMYGEREIGDIIFNFESQFEDSGISCKHHGSLRIPDIPQLNFVTNKTWHTKKILCTSHRTPAFQRNIYADCRGHGLQNPKRLTDRPRQLPHVWKPKLLKRKSTLIRMFCSWWFASTSAPSPFTKQCHLPLPR